MGIQSLCRVIAILAIVLQKAPEGDCRILQSLQSPYRAFGGRLQRILRSLLRGVPSGLGRSSEKAGGRAVP